MSKIKSITHDEWVEELFRPIGKKPDGWFTINDICAKTGIKRSTARDRISGMVASGELLVMYCFENGHKSKCYKKK